MEDATVKRLSELHTLAAKSTKHWREQVASDEQVYKSANFWAEFHRQSMQRAVRHEAAMEAALLLAKSNADLHDRLDYIPGMPKRRATAVPPAAAAAQLQANTEAPAPAVVPVKTEPVDNAPPEAKAEGSDPPTVSVKTEPVDAN